MISSSVLKGTDIKLSFELNYAVSMAFQVRYESYGIVLY